MSLGAEKDMEPQEGAPPAAAVKLRGLCKTYRARGTGAKAALSEVDLDIPRGSLFGLLGPNGAGKSTMINILAGLVNKTAGRAEIWGYDIDRVPRQARAAIGVVPQELNIDPFFTPYELLELQAGLYGVPPAERRSMEILTVMGLADKAKAYARALSGGMRRRLMVAKAMVHRPPVLVLDEPTAGVDVDLRRKLWSYVRELNRRGTTILLTTHYLEEAEQLCDRIAIINHGRVIACEATGDMLARLDLKELVLQVTSRLAAVPASLAAFDVELRGPQRLLFRYRMSESPVQEILAAAAAAGLTISDMSTREADLEDIFLQLTGGGDTPGDAAAPGEAVP